MNCEPWRSFVEASLGQVHYRTSGSGPALLLLHSSSGSSRVFQRFMRHMQDYRCVAPDLPGFGESAAMPTGASIEDVAAHLVSFLDALGIERANLFGLHSGNKVATALAADWSDRVQSVVIAGMTHSLIVDAEERNQAMLRYTGRKPASGGSGKKPWEDLCAKLDKILRDASGADATPDIERLATEMLDAIQARDGAEQMYPAILAFDLPGTLERVGAPGLIIELITENERTWGRQGSQLAAIMGHGKTITWYGNDREMLQSRPAELAELIRAFLVG